MSCRLLHLNHSDRQTRGTDVTLHQTSRPEVTPSLLQGHVPAFTWTRRHSQHT